MTYIIVEFQHVNPGKGVAFVRTKLKSLTKGKVLQHTFNAGVKIIIAKIERRFYQFLYRNGITYHFMDNQSFDQIELGESLINVQSPPLPRSSLSVANVWTAFCEPPASTLGVVWWYAVPDI